MFRTPYWRNTDLNDIFKATTSFKHYQVHTRCYTVTTPSLSSAPAHDLNSTRESLRSASFPTLSVRDNGRVSHCHRKYDYLACRHQHKSLHRWTTSFNTFSHITPPPNQHEVLNSNNSAGPRGGSDRSRCSKRMWQLRTHPASWTRLISSSIEWWSQSLYRQTPIPRWVIWQKWISREKQQISQYKRVIASVLVHLRSSEDEGNADAGQISQSRARRMDAVIVWYTFPIAKQPRELEANFTNRKISQRTLWCPAVDHTYQCTKKSRPR